MQNRDSQQRRKCKFLFHIKHSSRTREESFLNGITPQVCMMQLFGRRPSIWPDWKGIDPQLQSLLFMSLRCGAANGGRKNPLKAKRRERLSEDMKAESILEVWVRAGGPAHQTDSVSCCRHAGSRILPLWAARGRGWQFSGWLLLVGKLSDFALSCKFALARNCICTFE